MNIENWFWPQHFFVVWLSLMVYQFVMRQVRNRVDIQREVEAKVGSYGTAFLSDESKRSLFYFAVFLKVSIMFGPLLLILYDGGFFK